MAIPVVVLTCLLGLAGPLAAQSPRSDGSTLTIAPLVGNALFPSEMSAPFALDTLDLVAASGLENGFSPGLAVGLRLSRHVSAEVVGLFTSTELALDPEVGGPLGFDADVWLAAAGGRYLFLPAATVAPYAVAGAGVRHVRISVFGGEETDFMWNVGAGALFETGWVADVRVEVRDHMSEFRDDGAAEGRLQHDMWAGVGLEFGLL